MPTSPSTTQTRNFDLVDDAAIFIDDTFDSNMVKMIPGLLMSSPSAVVMLSPQRMPINENGEPQGKSPSASQMHRAQSERQRRNHLARCEKHHLEIEEEESTVPHSIKCEGTPIKDITNKSIPSGSSQKRIINRCLESPATGLTNSSSTQLFEKNFTNDNSIPKHEVRGSALCTVSPQKSSTSFAEKSNGIKDRLLSVIRNEDIIIGKDEKLNLDDIEQVESPPPKGNCEGFQCITVNEVGIDKLPQLGAMCLQETDEDDGDFCAVEEKEVTNIYTTEKGANYAHCEAEQSSVEEYTEGEEKINLSDHYVPIEDYEKVVKDRNRYREMYRYQAQMCDDYYKRERETQEKLQSKIVELVAVSSRCEESKRFIRQMKREMLQCRERALPFHNKKMDEIRYEKSIKEKYDNMLNTQREQFEQSERDLKQELSSMEILLSDLRKATEMGKSTESLLRAAYQKNGHLYTELCAARNDWQKELDRRMEADSALEVSKKNKHDWEVALSKERRRNFAREENLMQDTLDLQEEVISLREELAEMKIHATETLEKCQSVSRKLEESSSDDDSGDYEPKRNHSKGQSHLRERSSAVEKEESQHLMKNFTSNTKACTGNVKEVKRIYDSDAIGELVLSSVHTRRGITQKEAVEESSPRPLFTTTCVKNIQRSKWITQLNKELGPRKVARSIDTDEFLNVKNSENEKCPEKPITKCAADTTNDTLGAFHRGKEAALREWRNLMTEDLSFMMRNNDTNNRGLSEDASDQSTQKSSSCCPPIASKIR